MLPNGTENCLIQGFFFFRGGHLSVRAFPGEGNLAVVEKGVYSAMFAGVLTRDWIGGWEGETIDTFGRAKLRHVVLTADDLRYQKCYDDRSSPIHYEFRKQGEMWVGEYRGREVGTGEATCVVAPVQPELFVQPCHANATKEESS